MLLYKANTTPTGQGSHFRRVAHLWLLGSGGSKCQIGELCCPSPFAKGRGTTGRFFVRRRQSRLAPFCDVCQRPPESVQKTTWGLKLEVEAMLWRDATYYVPSTEDSSACRRYHAASGRQPEERGGASAVQIRILLYLPIHTRHAY